MHTFILKCLVVKAKRFWTPLVTARLPEAFVFPCTHKKTHKLHSWQQEYSIKYAEKELGTA